MPQEFTLTNQVVPVGSFGPLQVNKVDDEDGVGYYDLGNGWPANSTLSFLVEVRLKKGVTPAEDQWVRVTSESGIKGGDWGTNKWTGLPNTFKGSFSLQYKDRPDRLIRVSGTVTGAPITFNGVIGTRVS